MQPLLLLLHQPLAHSVLLLQWDSPSIMYQQQQAACCIHQQGP